MRVPLVDLRAQFLPIRDEIMRAIEDVFDSMHLFLGPQLRAFEEEFAAYCGASYCVGVSNGTDALHLALRAAASAKATKWLRSRTHFSPLPKPSSWPAPRQ